MSWTIITLNANTERDFAVTDWGDFTFVESGDKCPKCDGSLQIARGIEVGHVFQLGTKYSQSMDAYFLDANGKLKPFIMGSYGVGVSRLVAAAIEQHHDERGIIWPSSLTPYEVAVLVLQWEDKNLRKLGEEIYQRLGAEGIEVIIDDREESPGVKFADADLIGFPLQIIVGSKSFARGKVEIKQRWNGDKKEIDTSRWLDEIISYFRK